MSKIKMIIMMFLLGLISIMYFVYYDMTHISNKNLLKDKYMYVNYNGDQFLIENEVIKKIVNNSKYKWTISFASYAYPMHITNKDNTIMLLISKRNLVINYKNKHYGYIQLISLLDFPNIISEIIALKNNKSSNN